MSDRDFPLIGCVGHDCATCAANAQELAQLRAELATMRESRDAAVRLWNDCGEELATAQADRDNLLARIHRDGGHYLAEHGATKAVADADRIVAELFTAQAALKVRQAAIVRILSAWDAKMPPGPESPSFENAIFTPLEGAIAAARALATPANPPANPPKEETK